MSDTAIDKLLARIATLESKLAAQPAAPTQPAFDPTAFRNAFIADPVGVMTRMGMPVEHTTRVLVAHAMGDQAPPELKVLAQQGPQISATRALESQLADLSQQVKGIVTSSNTKSTRDKFNALIADKAKYPHLAKAFAADPSLFDEDLQSGASAEDIATKLEARQAKVAAAYGVKVEAPPASVGSADTTGQSTEGQAGKSGGDMPPIASTTGGLWNEAEHKRVRDEVLRKYPTQ